MRRRIKISKNKYRNKPVTIENIRFQSGKEREISYSGGATLSCKTNVCKIGDIFWSPLPMNCKNWILLDNSELDECDYNELFTFIGFKFGRGKKKGTFKLPDAKEKNGKCYYYIKFR